MSATASVNGLAATIADDGIALRAIDSCRDRLNKVAKKVFEQIAESREHLEFNCPITLVTMQDPRILPCGHTFELKAIQRSLANKRCCPECRTKVPLGQDLIKNLALKKLIEEWKEQECVLSLSKCTSENPTLAAQYLTIAHAYLGTGDHKEALLAFNQAFKHTRRAEDYKLVPALYEQLKKRDEATLSYLYLAFYQLNNDQVTEALQTLQHVKEMNPTLPLNGLTVGLEFLGPQPNLKRAMSLAAIEKNPEEAMFIYKQIIAHFPNDLEAYELLVALLKDPEEKRAILLQAAEIAEQQGRSDLALHFFKEAENQCISTVISQEEWANAATLKLPPYPPELVEFLAGNCDFDREKQRSQTHIVVPLFPEVSINDVQMPMTLESLDQLDKRSGGLGCREVFPLARQNILAEKEFHWAVMTKTVIPESRNKSYNEQVQLLPAGYEVPGLLDVARAILWEHRRTGRRCFGDEPPTYTHCAETIQRYQLVVGGFTSEGLHIDLGGFSKEQFGIAGWRKF